MKFIPLVFLVILLRGFVLQAQEEIAVLTKEEKEQAIEKAAELLQRFYVLPVVGEQMGTHIKKRFSEGAFDGITDKAVFADIINKELHSICSDKHLGVYIGPNPDEQTREGRNVQRIVHKLDNEKNNYGLSKVEILEGNVGYMKINSVMHSEEAMEILSSAMKFLSNAYAIIFDLRDNRGGDPGYMAYLFSYFFHEPTHINSIYWRDRDRTDEFWTHEAVSGRKMVDIPLYVLISKRTFSGAEEFAYDLQALNRATVIGEASAGGAHPAATWVVYKDLRISIPYGRAINPITGTNWEGVGVIPDIEVPAEEALEAAYKKAISIAEDYYLGKKASIIKALDELYHQMERAEGLFRENRTAEAEKIVVSSIHSAIERSIMNQAEVNEMGYNYLNDENGSMAIAIFEANVLEFPNSANVYDSLGEAYHKNGKIELAKKNYQKALSIDPDFASAKRALEDINK